MEGEGVGVVEFAQDDPDGLVASLFGEESVEKDEPCLGDSLRGD